MLVQCNQCEHFFFDEEDPDSDDRMRFDENDEELCPHCGESGCLTDFIEDIFLFAKHFGLQTIRSAILNKDKPTFTIRASDPHGQAAMAAYG